MPRANRIPKTGPTPELTRLKQLPAEQREQIVEWKQTLTGEQVRARIAAEFGVTLERDSQLSKFWRWQRGQNAVGAFGEMAEAAEEGLLKRMTPEQARQTVIKWTYQQSALLEDPALALKAVDRSQNEQRLQIDRGKLALLEKKASQAQAAQQVTESAATPAEKEAQMRAIFGLS